MQQRYKRHFEDIINFSEEIRLSDLKKSAGMSNFTKKFAKETNRLMGNPTNHSKLVDMKVNKSQDYITFTWVTERTPKYEDNFNMEVVNPKTWKFHKDNLYTIQIRILDFFKLLKTMPKYRKNKITKQDIKDVLEVADVKIWSDVPAFHWQGANYNLSMFDGSIYPTSIAPEHWDKYHNSDQLLDKHSAGIINSIAFYIPQMTQSIRKFMGLTNKK